MSTSSRKKQKETQQAQLPSINKNAAGIDVGSRSHFVAVPNDRDANPVKEFSCFTSDLYLLAHWLKECRITTVAMESTGIYWIPLFELLEEQGFDVKLVNAHHVKNVPGRKTDVLDCQWIQQLHSFGLLNGAFRPDDQVCALRAYLRHRTNLIQSASSYTLLMQKSLTQMNLLLRNVVNDITGVTGMKIIRAIVSGEHNPVTLASFRHPRCKESVETIAKSLEGHYRDEHIFSLKQSLEIYDAFQMKITECNNAIQDIISRFSSAPTEQPQPIAKPSYAHQGKNIFSFDLSSELFRITGVDLTQIDGINASTALSIISEIGTDMSQWPSEKHFSSWLGLSPGNKISGGKIISGKTKPAVNRVATALRMAAQSLHASKSALGAFFRRQKARLGPAKATTATAHKLARLVYTLLKNGSSYEDMGVNYYEQQYHSRILRNLKKRAADLGYQIVPTPPQTENL